MLSYVKIYEAVTKRSSAIGNINMLQTKQAVLDTLTLTKAGFCCPCLCSWSWWSKRL